MIHICFQKRPAYLSGKGGSKGAQGPAGFVGMEGGYCPCPKELRKLGFSDNSTTPIPDDLKPPLTPIGSPPSAQAPAPVSVPIGGLQQNPPNLLDSKTSNTLTVPNEIAGAQGQNNNLVQVP